MSKSRPLIGKTIDGKYNKKPLPVSGEVSGVSRESQDDLQDEGP